MMSDLKEQLFHKPLEFLTKRPFLTQNEENLFFNILLYINILKMQVMA